MLVSLKATLFFLLYYLIINYRLYVLVQGLQGIHAADSIIGLLLWSKRICINNEKSESGSSAQHDEIQTGDKTNVATSPQQSATQREYILIFNILIYVFKNLRYNRFQEPCFRGNQ